LRLSPPPCAVLLVFTYIFFVYAYVRTYFAGAREVTKLDFAEFETSAEGTQVLDVARLQAVQAVQRDAQDGHYQ